MDIMLIWIVMAVLYGVFWLWYSGTKGKLSQTEVESYMQQFESRGVNTDNLANLRHFLEKDDGREWFMINLLELKSPKRESSKLLQRYTKTFMAGMLRRAGHPFFVAIAAAKNIENLNCDDADNWSSTGIVRYRSRRDCAETLLDTFGSDHHADKLASLTKTLAFPATANLLMGSPRVIVAMSAALIGAMATIYVMA
ncbi:hypothetical protein N9L44_03590 [Porticoccaceae bacterium]|nr:hypothetical protein [Porticoccaceae bacterium]MDA8878583.1 hypothetical protein [Porticoccaceae bacterium]MDA9583379.1 hypothetical protein [Porticoccaceae bacterium]MDB2395561.1 hypothetical protein [Porticoccaceae bacterium]MDB2558418.1 hypothetical protein [Porticoccaceae bacterium]